MRSRMLLGSRGLSELFCRSLMRSCSLRLGTACVSTEGDYYLMRSTHDDLVFALGK